MYRNTQCPIRQTSLYSHSRTPPRKSYGTVFRAPITIPSIHPCVKNWEKPITIARHAYGDVYKSVEIRADEPGVAKLVFEGKSGKKQEVEIHNFDGAGVIQGMHNTDKSIRSFAHSCFKFAIDTKGVVI